MLKQKASAKLTRRFHLARLAATHKQQEQERERRVRIYNVLATCTDEQYVIRFRKQLYNSLWITQTLDTNEANILLALARIQKARKRV